MANSRTVTSSIIIYLLQKYHMLMTAFFWGVDSDIGQSSIIEMERVSGHANLRLCAA